MPFFTFASEIKRALHLVLSPIKAHIYNTLIWPIWLRGVRDYDPPFTTEFSTANARSADLARISLCSNLERSPALTTDVLAAAGRFRIG